MLKALTNLFMPAMAEVEKKKLTQDEIEARVKDAYDILKRAADRNKNSGVTIRMSGNVIYALLPPMIIETLCGVYERPANYPLFQINFLPDSIRVWSSFGGQSMPYSALSRIVLERVLLLYRV